MAPRRNKCMAVRELLGAYSIGATDPQETAFVERYLPECPELVAELAEYMEIADAMLYLPSAMEGKAAPVERVVDLQPHLTRHPQTPQQRQPAQAPSRPQTSWWVRSVMALGAAAIMILLGFNAFWFTQYRTLDERLDMALASLQQATTEAQLANVVIGKDQRHSVVNEDVNGHGSVVATLVWDNASQVGTFYVNGLNIASPDQTYNLWLARDGHTLNVGKIEVNDQRIGVLIFHSDEPIDGYSEFFLTADTTETAPEAPSENHLLTGRI